MGSIYIILIKKLLEIIYFWILDSIANHLILEFVSIMVQNLSIKLTILYNIKLNVRHIQKWYQNSFI